MVPGTVADNVSFLAKVMNAKATVPFAIIDHGAQALEAGLELRESPLMMLTNVTVGTPEMKASPLAALDSSLKGLT